MVSRHGVREVLLPPAWGWMAVLVTLALLWWASLPQGWERYDRGFLEDASRLRAQIVDRQAATYALPDRRGQVVASTHFAGRWVFLNFWASWCEPCREEMPAMARLAAAMDPQRFVMVAISLDEDEGAMERFLGDAGIDTSRMLILRDAQGSVARQFGTSLLPETYVIDPGGRVVVRFQGEYPWDVPDLRLFFERLMQRPWKEE